MGEQQAMNSTNSFARRTLPRPFPPPDKPLPARPSPPPAVPPRAPRTRRDDTTAVSSSVSSCSSSSSSTLTFIPADHSTPSSSSSLLLRHSAVTPEPLALPRRLLPRPDSTILPESPPLPPLPLSTQEELLQQLGQPHRQPSRLLAPCDFHAVVRQGDVVQYWLPVALVLRGMPGRESLPRGHWERVVQLAEAVAVGEGDSGVQLVTGWCSHDESLGEADESDDDVYEEEGVMVNMGW